MASDSASSAGSKAAFELKGAVSTLTVVRLLSDEIERIDEQLGKQVGQLPQFFNNAPVVVDLEPLEGGTAGFPFERMIELLRKHRLVPVAVRNVAKEREADAAAAGFGLLKGGLGRTKSDKPATKPPPPPPEDAPAVESSAGPQNAKEPEPLASEATEPAFAGGKIVRQPVRGGQIVYAQQRDLVMLAAVNAGAEVIADGSVHVYGPLRGRALAGAHGDTEARIFCTSLEAELVSVAGHYLRAEEIPPKLRGKPAQVFLDSGQLVVRGL